MNAIERTVRELLDGQDAKCDFANAFEEDRGADWPEPRNLDQWYDEIDRAVAAALRKLADEIDPKGA